MPGYSILRDSSKEDLPFNKANHMSSLSNKLTLFSKKLLSSISIILLAYSFPSSTFAGVGEGDLPAGVQAFTRLLNAKNDFVKVEQTIEKRAKELTLDEQLGLQFFFKRFANEEIDDMNFLSKSILDPSKKKEATEVAKSVRKYMLQFDRAISDEKYDDVINNYSACKAQIDRYFDLLQDVPDEL